MKRGWINRISVGDAETRLREMPDASIDVVVTSPPFFMIRDYGVEGQIGREDDVAAWVDRMTAVTAQLARVLTPHGSVWLEIGDSVSRHSRFGAPAKSLLLAPERLMIAMVQQQGWIWRQRVIWSKTNPLPRGIDDRLTPSHSLLLHLTRSPQYFFDRDAVRDQVPGGLGRDPGDVWPLPTQPGWRPGSHPATFPVELARRPILASCPEAVCLRCGRPWRRVSHARRIYRRDERYRPSFALRYRVVRHRGPLIPCGCDAGTRAGRVLDPFCGTGTVCVAAKEAGREWIGIELHPGYARLARQRLRESPQGQTA